VPTAAEPPDAEANSPIAIDSWPATAISGAVVLVRLEEGLFVMFKSVSTSLILLSVAAISCIRG